MAHPHSSTPAQRVQIVRQLFQQDGHYGAVSALSRQWHISRQSLYTGRDRALAAGRSVEFRRRAEALLALPPGIVRNREVLRGVRAVQMLEASGGPASRERAAGCQSGSDWIR